MIDGIVVADNLEQFIERSGTKRATVLERHFRPPSKWLRFAVSWQGNLNGWKDGWVEVTYQCVACTASAAPHSLPSLSSLLP